MMVVLRISPPLVLRNHLKHEVIAGRAAFNGLMIGKTVFYFENGRQKHSLKNKNLIAG